MKLASQGKCETDLNNLPRLFKLAPASRGVVLEMLATGKRRGERTEKISLLGRLFERCTNNPPRQMSQFPNGIILGPPCGSFSGPRLKGRLGGVSCAQLQR